MKVKFEFVVPANMSFSEAVFNLPKDEKEMQEYCKATFVHDSDSDDKEDLEIFLASKRMYCAIWEFSQKVLRTNRKYRELTEEQYKMNEEIEEKFWEILNEEGIGGMF